MTVINTADKIYVGSSLASKVYSGANQVWPPAAAYDAATTAWIAAVGSGNVSATRRGVVDTLITGLKTDGVWALLDRLLIFAAENQQSALVDMVALSTATAVNAPTFTSNSGYTVNGTSYVDLGYKPVTNAVHFSRNFCHVGAWNLINSMAGDLFLTDNPGTGIAMYPGFPGNLAYIRLQDSSGGGVSISNSSGWIVGDRASSANRDTYRNGATLGNVTVSSAVVADLPTVLWIGSGAAVSFGSSLNATQHSNFYARLRTYMTAVGVP
jgi:hypothetical protein